jgi:hypothetical protein
MTLVYSAGSMIPILTKAESRLMRKLARRRWAAADAETRRAVGQALAKASWAGMSAAERSVEMKRRIAKRRQK